MSEDSRFPIEEWGKDHFSLVGYVECRCVDHQGVPDHSRMRTNAGRHPGLVGSECRGLPPWEPGYGTRLKGFWKPDKTTDPSRQIPFHDDWDCWYDLEEAGVIKDVGTGINPVAKLTPFGKALAAALRAHKADGGQYNQFSDKIPDFLKTNIAEAA